MAIVAPNLLAISLSKGYNWIADECEVPEVRAKIARELQSLLDCPVLVEFNRSLAEGLESDTELSTGTLAQDLESPQVRSSEPERDPMVQRIVQLFDARPVYMEADDQ